MSDNLFGFTDDTKITLIGAGGAGCRILDRIIASGIQGVKTVASDSDTASLSACNSPHKVQPDGIKSCVEGSDLVLVLAGMGGSTGSGVAPSIAEAAKSSGALVVAVVTKPFGFEQGRRLPAAEDGIAHLKEHTDAIIVVDNNALAQGITDEAKALKKSDDAVCQIVRGITDLITASGFINLDFEDIRYILDSGEGKMSVCTVGIGEAEGEGSAERAAVNAIHSPLMARPLGEAARFLLNVTTSADVTLTEMTGAANVISENVSGDSDIVWGHVIDDTLGSKVRAALLAVYPESAAVK